MADALTIDVTSLIKGAAQVKGLGFLLTQKLNDVLTAGAVNIQREAKSNAARVAHNTGNMASEIFVDNEKPLEKHITVNAFYAPFVEFGTGKYAASYASNLPGDWQAFAAQFKAKGKGKGTADLLFENMLAWVRRKGIHGITKGGRSKRGKKADADIYNIAYVITISILRNGIKPHPFLYPAYAGQRQAIKTDVETVLKSL